MAVAKEKQQRKDELKAERTRVIILPMVAVVGLSHSTSKSTNWSDSVEIGGSIDRVTWPVVNSREERQKERENKRRAKHAEKERLERVQKEKEERMRAEHQTHVLELTLVVSDQGSWGETRVLTWINSRFGLMRSRRGRGWRMNGDANTSPLCRLRNLASLIKLIRPSTERSLTLCLELFFTRYGRSKMI